MEDVLSGSMTPTSVSFSSPVALRGLKASLVGPRTPLVWIWLNKTPKTQPKAAAPRLAPEPNQSTMWVQVLAFVRVCACFCFWEEHEAKVLEQKPEDGSSLLREILKMKQISSNLTLNCWTWVFTANQTLTHPHNPEAHFLFRLGPFFPARCCPSVADYHEDVHASTASARLSSPQFDEFCHRVVFSQQMFTHFKKDNYNFKLKQSDADQTGLILHPEHRSPQTLFYA